VRGSLNAIKAQETPVSCLRIRKKRVFLGMVGLGAAGVAFGSGAQRMIGSALGSGLF
jgi:hypothetical protein